MTRTLHRHQSYHERNLTKKLNRVARNYSSATISQCKFHEYQFRDVGSPAKLKLIVPHQWRWPPLTIQEVVGSIKSNGTVIFYETVQGISFIRSLLQVADRKSTLWAGLGLNRVVDQNDGTSRIETCPPGQQKSQLYSRTINREHLTAEITLSNKSGICNASCDKTIAQ